MLHEYISKTKQQLDKQILSIQKKLLDFPEGNLICCHNGKYCKWYNSDGHTRKTIPKSNASLAEQLAIKKYYSYLLEDLLQEQKALESYLKHHNLTSKSERLTNLPGYASLLHSHFRPASKELSDWISAPFEHNPKHPDHLIHKTLSGHYVRSKSESMIDSLLFTNKIPFRYECALVLDGISIFPDFTVRHPSNYKTYYWEHFGLMDDPTYRQKTSAKLQFYISHNIIPSINLITTYETQQNPLTAEMIQKNIEHYFL